MELPVLVLEMNEEAEPTGFTATMEPPKEATREEDDIANIN